MKNNLFLNATALAIGSLVVFSGQALVLASNHQKFIDANALSNSEILIAQATSEQPSEDSVRACSQVIVALTLLGETKTIIKEIEEQIIKIPELDDIPPGVRTKIADKLNEAIGAMSRGEVFARKDENVELVGTITLAISILKNVATAIANGEVGQTKVINGVIADAEQGCQFIRK